MTVPAAAGAVPGFTNGRLADGRIVDITLQDGAITEIRELSQAPGLPDRAAGLVDLGGRLVLPTMVEPHAHLDKALTAEIVPNPTGDLLGAITAWDAAAAAGAFTHEATVTRACAAIDRLLANGVTAVRTHVNVLPAVGAAGVRAVREAAAVFADVVDVQIVALTGNPVTGAEGAAQRAALDAAVEEGVDAIGGCPHLEADGAALIGHALDVATRTGLPLDLHIDEGTDAGVLTLHELARQVASSNFPHAVTASHCVSLGMQPVGVQAAVAADVAAAGITVHVLPQTNLFLQGRGQPVGMPRGLTALDALTDAGVTIAAGGDNVQDPFNLVGRSDPLETAALMVLAGHRLPDIAFAMVSRAARASLRLPAVDLGIGSPADLLVIDAPSVRGAIADAPASRAVYRGGRLVAATDVTRWSINRT